MESLITSEPDWLDIKQYLSYNDGETFVFDLPHELTINWQHIRTLFSRFYQIRSIEYMPLKNRLTIKIFNSSFPILYYVSNLQLDA